MLKNLLLKQILKKQMTGIPEEQQEQMIAMIQKNPELFQKIAMETQELIKKGKSQMDSIMEVAKKYEEELKGLS